MRYTVTLAKSDGAPMPLGSFTIYLSLLNHLAPCAHPFTSRSLPADHRDQIAYLPINLRGMRHSVRHFLSHQFAEAAAQPSRCAPDGAFGHVQLAPQFGVGQPARGLGAGAEDFQALIKPGLGCHHVLLAQASFS